ncbi:MAG: diguanylate cyclase, partial [Phycisphaerae bacterium]|nr:diguanylate cyclase [Phycisphaerae bacterium]
MNDDMNDSGKCPRILVVEDDCDQRQLICETLCMHYRDKDGENIVGVASAAECLQQDLESFDVVLQDYHLCDMDGLELLRHIISQADLPVIFVTGENDSAVAAEAIRRGAQDYILKLGDYLFAIPVIVDKNIHQHDIKRENIRLQRELETMLSELRVKNKQLEESLEKVRTMATIDHLTGLDNRRQFNETLERYFSEAIRYGFDLTCCMCDLDHFKEFNDTFGHQLGDELLVMTAEVVRSSLRSTDVAARYGGDEIVLLLPHTLIERGLAVAERIRHELVVRAEEVDSVRGNVTISIGIA